MTAVAVFFPAFGFPTIIISSALSVALHSAIEWPRRCARERYVSPRPLQFQMVLDGFSKVLNAFASAACALARTRAAGCHGLFATFPEAALERIPPAADAFRVAADYDSISARRDDTVGWS